MAASFLSVCPRRSPGSCRASEGGQAVERLVDGRIWCRRAFTSWLRISPAFTVVTLSRIHIQRKSSGGVGKYQSSSPLLWVLSNKKEPN
ncbi:hypothetical protein CHARACLAT_002335 [Characodon lateralis]|uniref:Uncharacterized protein n=1 Tax=Characodon lateralis TaxID=208331 RepID=A0ABU7E120_9TELE|nr:hypothetical protein [Characodon lateralis]